MRDCTILVGKPEEKYHLGDLSLDGKKSNIIKIYMIKTRCESWDRIQLAQDKVLRIVSKVKNIRFHKRGRRY
jgi:hypothetical protein